MDDEDEQSHGHYAPSIEHQDNIVSIDAHHNKRRKMTHSLRTEGRQDEYVQSSISKTHSSKPQLSNSKMTILARIKGAESDADTTQYLTNDVSMQPEFSHQQHRYDPVDPQITKQPISTSKSAREVIATSVTPTSSNSIDLMTTDQSTSSNRALQLSSKRKPLARPKIVLEEDHYIDALSIIIKRDFYPELVQLDAESDYLESIAVDSADSHRIRAATRRLTEIALHSAPTPRCDSNTHNPMLTVPSTPSFDSVATHPKETERHYNTDMSLDAFLDRYTSEDNASFREIVDKINQKRQDTFDRLFGHDPDSLKLIAHGKTDDDGKIHRPAAIEGSKFEPRNSLMYYPDNEEGSPFIPSRAQPKAIVHSNTRLTYSEVSSSVASSPSQSHIEAVINGTPYPRRRLGGEETPRVNGYSMVDASPSPSELGRNAEESLPHLVSSVKKQGFRIPETPRRDLIGQRLSERASRNLRAQKSSAGNARSDTTPHRESSRMQSPSVRASMLSPAAQRLLQRSGRPSQSPSSTPLRGEWTMTPKTSRK